MVRFFSTCSLHVLSHISFLQEVTYGTVTIRFHCSTVHGFLHGFYEGLNMIQYNNDPYAVGLKAASHASPRKGIGHGFYLKSTHCAEFLIKGLCSGFLRL